MAEELLSVVDVSTFERITHRAVLKRIASGKLQAHKLLVKGKKGFEYRIPLSALSKVQKGIIMEKSRRSLTTAYCPMRNRKRTKGRWRT